MGAKEAMAEWKWGCGEERDWGSVKGQAVLIWRLNEPSDASDTPSDLLWSLAEWHHSGDGKKAGVGEGQKKKSWDIDGFQIPSDHASEGGSCGRQWERPERKGDWRGFLEEKEEEKKTKKKLFTDHTGTCPYVQKATSPQPRLVAIQPNVPHPEQSIWSCLWWINHTKQSLVSFPYSFKSH